MTFQSITQFELEDTELANGAPGVLPSALGWIVSLRNLRACSLPACIAPPRHSSSGAAGAGFSLHTFASASTHSPAVACRLLNRALISLRHLQRLGLARCYLGGQLHILLGGLSQPLEYLNIQDCSLTADDVDYLVFNWRPLPCLYELNLARNNLASVPQLTMAQLFWRTCFSQTGRLACLSLAYTCMSFDQLTWILKILTGEIKPRDIVPIETTASPLSSDDSDAECISSKCTLRVLCLQNFVPPTEEVGLVLLHLAVALPRLRFFHLYPAFYAFPGATEKEQRRNRSQEIVQSNAYIRRRGCNNLQIIWDCFVVIPPLAKMGGLWFLPELHVFVGLARTDNLCRRLVELHIRQNPSEDVTEAIRYFGQSYSPGPDGVLVSVLNDIFPSLLYKIFNPPLESATFPILFIILTPGINSITPTIIDTTTFYSSPVTPNATAHSPHASAWSVTCESIVQ
ncbi:unnamed protein product, partial [Schistocephalus solidus]|uniref:Leucine-rich repeat-containing protein 14 n=1 Tax=Schistocephalus solidus TaxID=70667 RepID=A0A183TDR3_SCHSO